MIGPKALSLKETVGQDWSKVIGISTLSSSPVLSRLMRNGDENTERTAVRDDSNAADTVQSTNREVADEGGRAIFKS